MDMFENAQIAVMLATCLFMITATGCLAVMTTARVTTMETDRKLRERELRLMETGR